MEWHRRHVLGLSDFHPEEMEFVIDTARSMEEVLTRDIKKVPALRGKTVVNLFFEASTRTRTSFEIAGKRLSADVVNFSSSTSSVTKGETLLDTARNIEAMGIDVIVIRHKASGAPHSEHEKLICKYAAPGAGPAQRSDLCRVGAGLCRPGPDGGRAQHAPTDRVGL